MPFWWWVLASVLVLALILGPLNEWAVRWYLGHMNFTKEERRTFLLLTTEHPMMAWWTKHFAKPYPQETED